MWASSSAHGLLQLLLPRIYNALVRNLFGVWVWIFLLFIWVDILYFVVYSLDLVPSSSNNILDNIVYCPAISILSVYFLSYISQCRYGSHRTLRSAQIRSSEPCKHIHQAVHVIRTQPIIIRAHRYSGPRRGVLQLRSIIQSKKNMLLRWYVNTDCVGLMLIGVRGRL